MLIIFSTEETIVNIGFSLQLVLHVNVEEILIRSKLSRQFKKKQICHPNLKPCQHMETWKL